MTVRRVVTRSGRGVRGYFPSRKMGRLIQWESLLERDAILHFEYSPGVRGYREQPERLEFWYEDGVASYVPDFALVLIDESELRIEVKPEDKLRSPKISRRLAAIADHYAATRLRFRILTERDVRREPRSANLRLLAYHASRLDESELRELQSRVKLLPPRTVAGAAAVCGDFVSVYRLLAAGCYRCDLDLPILPETAIHEPNQEDCHATLLF